MLRKFQKNLENTGIFNWRWFTEVFQGLCKHHKERCEIFLRVLVHFFRAPVTASTQQGAKYNSSLRIFITLPLPKKPQQNKTKATLFAFKLQRLWKILGDVGFKGYMNSQSYW